MIIFKNYFSVLQPYQDQQYGNILTLITLQEHENQFFIEIQTWSTGKGIGGGDKVLHVYGQV